jgi:hypothetical protein
MSKSEVQNFISRDFIGLNPDYLEQGSGAQITPVTYPTEV